MKADIKDINELTNNAIQKSYDNANSEWRTAAQSALIGLCRRGRPFTADDVWRVLKDSNVETHNHSALGGIFKNAERDGYITPSGDYRLSERPSRHRAILRVWKPITYKGKALI